VIAAHGVGEDGDLASVQVAEIDVSAVKVSATAVVDVIDYSNTNARLLGEALRRRSDEIGYGKT